MAQGIVEAHNEEKQRSLKAESEVLSPKALAVRHRQTVEGIGPHHHQAQEQELLFPPGGGSPVPQA